MTFFWTGIITFLIGVAVRWSVKFKYYTKYKSTALTDRHRHELRDKYRTRIFIGLALEVIGLIFSIIALWAD